jgi:hypothetical protein
MIPIKFRRICSLPLLEFISNHGVEVACRKEEGAVDSKS